MISIANIQEAIAAEQEFFMDDLRYCMINHTFQIVCICVFANKHHKNLRDIIYSHVLIPDKPTMEYTATTLWKIMQELFEDIAPIALVFHEFEHNIDVLHDTEYPEPMIKTITHENKTITLTYTRTLLTLYIHYHFHHISKFM